MSAVEDQQTKNLKYLAHVLRNGTANIMGCMKEIEKELADMTEAINTYKKDLGNEYKLSDGKDSEDK